MLLQKKSRGQALDSLTTKERRNNCIQGKWKTLYGTR